MKVLTHLTSSLPASRRARSGMALIMVVLMLALMLVFMLAVYTLSDSELKGASKQASGVQAKQLGDLAVDVVMAQVRKGTTQDTTNVGRELWTSQPGLVRQHDASGSLLAGYKLYSSSQMVAAGGEQAELKLLSDAPPEDWATQPQRYVDLNRPIRRLEQDGTTTLHFPIIDPRAMTGDEKGVSGFSYTDTLANGKKVKGVQKTGGNAQRLPMPVEWLYVLADGTLGTLDADNRFVGPVTPTVENPITGRVAFWADDESSKVNINTASEPTPWATPTFFHKNEADYALYQPTSGEYQRYPGHPASTALSPILFPNRTLTGGEKALIYNLAPRIGNGGSQAGTISYRNTSQVDLQPFLDARKERLYASLDEFLLREDRLENNFGADVSAREVLGRKGFFLTAHSRAPELNLQGLPKVAIWPISYRGADYTTSFDQLISFCSTLRQTGTKPQRKYLFQRGYADATTNDILNADNQALLGYLQTLLAKPLPGFAAVPSQNFQAKYGDDLRQILVEIFDYVRSTNLYDGNIVQDPRVIAVPAETAANFLLGYATGSSRPTGFKTFTDQRFQAPDTSEDADTSGNTEKQNQGYPGHGQVTPSQWTTGGRTYQGLGRFPTITEVGLHFICAADNTNDTKNTFQEFYPATLGKPGGGSAPTLDGKTPQARWYSNFPPSPLPNPASTKAAEAKPDNVKYPLTNGFPYGPDKTHPGYQQVNWNHQLAANTPLRPGVRRIQARMLFEFFVPAAGYTLLEPEITVRVSGLSQFKVNGQALFPSDTQLLYTGRKALHNGSGNNGGYGLGVKALTTRRHLPARSPMPADPQWGSEDWKVKPSTSSGDDRSTLNYDLLSNFVDIDVGRDGLTAMQISAANVRIEIFSGHVGRLASSGASAEALVQTLLPTFPANTVKAPTLVRNPIGQPGDALATEAPSWWSFYIRGAVGITARAEILTRNKLGPNSAYAQGRSFINNAAPRSGSAPGRGAFFYGFDGQDASTRFFSPVDTTNVLAGEESEGSDVVQTVLIKHGDYRSTAAMAVVGADQWQPHRYYGQRRLAHSFTSFTSHQLPGYDRGSNAETASNLVGEAAYTVDRQPDPLFQSSALEAVQNTRDFDNGVGPARDGPYINKPDEGNLNVVPTGVPYFEQPRQHLTADDVYFTPNRIVNSPVVFGSLPSGVLSGKVWRTLHFRPQQNHPGGPEKLGGTNPPDHLLLEYFWMPVVEPYAISEPFSTAGKINLNYQIFPFTNIRRASGLHAIFAGERLTAIPTSDAASYKSFANGQDYSYWTDSQGKRWHYKIDAEKTLAQFDARFSTGGAFRSASEICDIYLVPQGASDAGDASQMESFWRNHRLTGDNTRERPYANIYPRVTTRSNTFRVHYIAQVIRKARSTSPAVVTDADRFESEYRGSSVIERYLDPAQSGLPDCTTSAVTDSNESLDNYYQFRVLERRKFGN